LPRRPEIGVAGYWRRVVLLRGLAPALRSFCGMTVHFGSFASGNRGRFQAGARSRLHAADRRSQIAEVNQPHVACTERSTLTYQLFFSR
jgi:hypothetical protein